MRRLSVRDELQHCVRASRLEELWRERFGEPPGSLDKALERLNLWKEKL